ncbi:MAG: WYL domain-containing protein [Gammaproteobacteria bacterium]|nr:WYL domain-containing protein [Gammaproteobacteria bacterium]
MKWSTRQRLQYIEIKAWYTGTVSRSDVAKAFAISDAAATKDLNFYNQAAPNNLIYKHSVYGFVPSDSFREIYADLSPAAVLPLFTENLAVIGGPSATQDAVYGISVDTLPLPTRLPDKFVLAQLVRAVKNNKKLLMTYKSLSGRDDSEQRTIEPHSLINTGLRWHVRAYSQDTFDFRDYVLSRITQAEMLDEEAESGVAYDDDWVEHVVLQLAPHPGLDEKKRLNLLYDYGAENDVIELNVRRSLVGYVLQKLSVDTTADHSLNPNKYQMIVLNRDEIEPFAGWAFL